MSPVEPVREIPLLKVSGLGVRFREKGRPDQVAVAGLDYHLYPGKTLAIVGESGSGKTVSCRALLGLLPDKALVTGSARLRGKELIGLSERELRRHRGADIAMVFQDPGRALDPVMPVGRQVADALLSHHRMAPTAARHRAVELLGELGLGAPERQFYAYPHQLSGGMQQRVMLAVAMACRPGILIADEATRSLDVTTQAHIMELLGRLQEESGLALIFITHDLGLAASVADDVLVLRAGRIEEYAPAERLFSAPRSAYGRALLTAAELTSEEEWMARRRRRPMAASPLLSVRNLVQEFDTGAAKKVQALSGVSFDLYEGESLAIVGETGSGKSTLARTLLGIHPPLSGSIWYRGEQLTKFRGKAPRARRREIQMVFQDCFASLNPKWRVLSIVEEPLIALGSSDAAKRHRKVAEVLEWVGLTATRYGHRRPGQLSGGQCQRVAIARALVTNPRVLVLDEALSSLDALVQQQLLELLRRLREALNLSYIFISHDLSRVQRLCDRVAVMYAGRLCETGPVEELFHGPRHPYTAALLDAIPRPGAFRGKKTPSPQVRDEPASPLSPPSGCRFHPRCPRAKAVCAREAPVMRGLGQDHALACHFRFAPAHGDAMAQLQQREHKTLETVEEIFDRNCLEETSNFKQGVDGAE